MTILKEALTTVAVTIGWIGIGELGEGHDW